MKKIVLAILLLTVALLSNEIDKAYEAIDKKDYKTALAILKPLAEKGNPEAAVAVGLMYDKGLGVKQDYKEVVRWYKLAAKNGMPKVNLTIGAIYFSRLRNYGQAIKYLKKCANKNNIVCSYSLGLVYHDVAIKGLSDKVASNKGAKYFYEESIKTLKKVASKMPNANAEIGDLYYRGALSPYRILIVKPNYKKAKEYLNKAIESKNSKAIADAGLVFGLMYLKGNGVLQDYKESEKYFKLAIKNGNKTSKCALGLLYIKQNKISQAKQILKEGYEEGEESCRNTWNQYNLGQY